MPKRPSAADTYDSDGGFVADASPPGGSKNKRAKTGERKGSALEERGGGGDGVVGERRVGKDGGEYWELSGKRRVQVSEYAGKWMVGIREYYEKDGEMLPGKKGISLTLPQFNTLVSLLPHIESVLVGKGESVDRPDYGGVAAAAAAAEEEEEEDEGGEDEVEDVEGGGRKGKTNFEETSDED